MEQANLPKCPEGLELKYIDGELALVGGDLVLKADLQSMLPRLKKNNLQGELLVRAAKIKGADRPLYAVDATAGLGEDAILLAAAGFNVRLYEYDPIIAALLRDAIRRGRDIPELSEIVSRMELHEENSIEALKKMTERPDVVLLDPMFPARNKSALIKKKFQLLQKLESPCSDETELLEAARLAHPHKIVIKRPLKGPLLAGVKPSFSLEGKAIRYDCIVLV